MVAEYIVKLKGDMSNLESVLKKYQSETKKLNDDEILIKLNYDGNVKSLNNVISDIVKTCPELSIQFQYDVNKKAYEKSIEQLKQIEDFKLDIDTSRVNEKIRAMVFDIRKAYDDAIEDDDQLKERVRNLYRYINTATMSGVRVSRNFTTLEDVDEQLEGYITKINHSAHPIQLFDIDTDLDTTINKIKSNIEEAQHAMEYFKKEGAIDRGDFNVSVLEDEIKTINNRVDELNNRLDGISTEKLTDISVRLDEDNNKLNETIKLVDELKQKISSNTSSLDTSDTVHQALSQIYQDFEKFSDINQDKHISDYFLRLKQKIDEGDESLRKLLKDAKLLNKDGSLTLINDGLNNRGGIIGEDQVLIARDSFSRFRGNMIEYAGDLKNRIDEAYESGAKVARILDIIGDKSEQGRHFFEIQQKIQDQMLGNIYGQNGTENDFLNPEFLDATNEQLLELLKTIELIHKAGLGVDLNLTNLYYGDKGFTISDLNLEPQQNLELEYEDLYFELSQIKELLYYDDSHGKELVDNLLSKITQLKTEVKNQSKEIGEEIGESISEGLAEGIDAHSNSKRSEKAGDNFVNGLTHSIEEHTKEAVDAAEQLGQAVSDKLDENLTTVYRGIDRKDATQFTTTTGRSATFGTTNKSLAEQYAMFGGQLLEAKADLQNALIIDGKGRDWNDIEYLGNGADEASKKIIALSERIKELQNILLSTIQDGDLGKLGLFGMSSTRTNVETGEVYDINDLSYTIDGSEKIYDSIIPLIEEENALESIHNQEVKSLVAELYETEKAYKAISDAEDNVYGRHSTDEFADLAAKNGIQAIVFEGIKDSFDKYSYASNVVAIIDDAIIKQDQFTKTIDETNESLQRQHDISNETSVSLEKSSPSQQFDNNIQQNLVSLENYKNTIAEIDKLKLEPETEETKHKIEELNKLADYFASRITTIRSENGHEINRSMMQFGGFWNEHLKEHYTEDQRKDFWKIAGERSGLNIDKVTTEFNGIDDIIQRIEDKSESLRQSLNASLSESRDYAEKLRTQFLMLIDNELELKVSTNKEDIEDYKSDIADILKKYPQLEQFMDKFTTYGQAKTFVQSDEWQDFLATLPQAHTYLESLGYDFERISQQSSETPILNADNQSVTDNIVEESAVRDKNAEVIREETTAQEALNQAQQEAMTVQNQVETEDLNNLLSLLIAVKQAVDEKTAAFGQEGLVVGQTVKAENDDLSLLLETINAISDSLGGIKLPTEGKLDWVKDLKKIDANQIQILSSSLKDIYDSIKKLDLKDSNFVNQLNGILTKGKELENLAKVLSSSKKDLNDTAKATKSNKQAESKKTYDAELANRKKILDLEYKIAKAKAEGDDGDLTEKRYRPEINALENIVKAESKRRAEQKLTSREYRNNIEHELSAIKQKQNAELEGIRAVTAERNRQAQQQSLVGNIDQQLKDLENAKKSINDLLGQKRSGLTPSYVQDAEEKVEELAKHIERLKEMRVDIIDAKDLTELNEATKLTQDLIKDAKDVKTSATDAANKLAKDIKIKNLDEEITDFLTKNTKLSAEFRVELDALRKKLSGDNLSNQDILDIASAFAVVKTRAKEAGDVGRSQLDSLKQRLSDMNTKFLARFFSLQDVIRYGRTIVSTIQDLDYSLVDLRKTTTMSASELNEFYYSANDVAVRLGQTTKEIINQAAAWSRLGYSSKEAATQMAELSSQFAAISPGMSLDDATDGLVSTMKGFGIAVEDTERTIMDNVNRIGRNMPKHTVMYGVTYVA